MLRPNRYLPPLRQVLADAASRSGDSLPVDASDSKRASSRRGRMPRLRDHHVGPVPPLPDAASTSSPAAPRLPRGVPAVTSHPGRIRGITLTERIVTLTPSIDNLVTELRAANLYIRPSNQLGHPAHVNPDPAQSVQMTSYGLIASFGVYDPNIPSDFYNTDYLDGTSATVNFSETLNGWSTGSSCALWDGWFTAVYSATGQFGNLLFTGGVQLQVWKDKFRVGPAFINTFLSSGIFLAYGGFVQLSPKAQITDLGPYLGPDAEGLARAHGIDYEKDGLRRTEVVRSKDITISGRGGGGTFWIAALARVDATRGRKTVFRTMNSTARTHDLLFEGEGLRQYFKDRFRALGWKKDIVTIPDQHRPMDLKLGDEVVVTRSGSLVIDLLVGNLSVWAGAQVLYRGDVEVSVHRLDEHRFEVVFNPTRLRDHALYLFSPFGPEVDIGKGLARSYRQGYIFDLREPEAAEAYQLAIDGKMPTQKRKFSDLDPTYTYRGDLAAAIAEENATLPHGVERIFVHLIRTEETQIGGGVHWGVVPLECLPHGWTNSVAYRRIRAHEKQTITDGQTVDYANSRNVEYRSELLMCGINSDEISAQQRWRSEPDLADAFNGLTLEATLTRGCVRKLRNNANIVKPLNKAFDLQLGNFTRPGLKQRREVDLSREIDVQGLRILEDYHHVWTTQRALSGRQRVDMQLKLAEVAQATGIHMRHFRTMLQGMHDAPQLKDKITPVQIFVQQHGLRGFAAIHRLVPQTADRPLSLDSICSTYIEALTSVERAQLRYPNPISKDDDHDAIKQRLERYEKALGKIDRAVADLQDDPLISQAERPLIESHLVGVREKLLGLIRMDGEAGSQVKKKLAHAFWRKGARYRRYMGLLEGANDWRAEVAHLERSYRQQPMPQERKPLVARWTAVYHAALRLADRLQWLSDRPMLLTSQQREQEMQEGQTALERLVGSPKESDFPAGPPRGLIDLSQIPATAREHLLEQRFHTHRSAAQRSLVRHLRALRSS